MSYILKKLKPVTPSQRNTILIQKPKKKIQFKSLVKGFKRSNGRNNQGKITVRHRGGGHKRLYRDISFNRKNINGSVISLEYDPNRSAHIAGVTNNNFNYYILAPDGIKLNDYIESGDNVPLKIGNSLPLKSIPIGTTIHNLSLFPNSKGKLIRSAGCYAQLIQKDFNTNLAKIRLRSNQLIFLSLDCYATIGSISNLNHKNIKIGKAGRSRWLNRRPKVRGVAKNPVDHPHGGGEGKTSGGRPSVNPQGRLTKGVPTRKNKKKLILN